MLLFQKQMRKNGFLIGAAGAAAAAAAAPPPLSPLIIRLPHQAPSSLLPHSHLSQTNFEIALSVGPFILVFGSRWPTPESSLWAKC